MPPSCLQGVVAVPWSSVPPCPTTSMGAAHRNMHRRHRTSPRGTTSCSLTRCSSMAQTSCTGEVVVGAHRACTVMRLPWYRVSWPVCFYYSEGGRSRLKNRKHSSQAHCDLSNNRKTKWKTGRGFFFFFFPPMKQWLRAERHLEQSHKSRSYNILDSICVLIRECLLLVVGYEPGPPGSSHPHADHSGSSASSMLPWPVDNVTCVCCGIS